MKTCMKCGAQMPDNAVACSSCGAPLIANKVPRKAGQKAADDKRQEPVRQTSEQTYVQAAPVTVDNPAKGKAIAALILGIVGILLGAFPSVKTSLLGIIICIIGIVLGVKARNAVPVGAPFRSMGTAGFVCSIIGLILCAIVAIACVVTYLVCSAAAFATTQYCDDWSELVEEGQYYISLLRALR